MATKRSAIAAVSTIRSTSISRQFSASSSRPNGLAMSSPVLDIFDAPARLEDWASRCLRSTYRSRPAATEVSPQDAEMSSLPPPITFDGPSGTRPKHYKKHALMVSPVSSSSVVTLFDGPARPARIRQRGRASVGPTPTVNAVLSVGAAIATLIFIGIVH